MDCLAVIVVAPDANPGTIRQLTDAEDAAWQRGDLCVPAGWSMQYGFFFQGRHVVAADRSRGFVEIVKDRPPSR